MKKVSHCIQCELLEKKRFSKATHWVKEGGEDIPLCDECYEIWLAEEDFVINLKEEYNADYFRED